MFNWFKKQQSEVKKPTFHDRKLEAALEVILFKCRSGRYTIDQSVDLVLKLFGRKRSN